MEHSIFWGYQILCDTGTADMQISVSALPYFGERFLANHNTEMNRRTWSRAGVAKPVLPQIMGDCSDKSRHQIQRSQRLSVEFICC